MINKYFNIKSATGDSKGESNRYYTLVLMQKLGEIRDLEKQPTFKLLGNFQYGDKKIQGMQYTADFQYFDVKKNKIIVEEYKSKYTAKLTDYILRKKLLQFQLKDKFNEIEFVEIIK